MVHRMVEYAMKRLGWGSWVVQVTATMSVYCMQFLVVFSLCDLPRGDGVRSEMSHIMAGYV